MTPGQQPTEAVRAIHAVHEVRIEQLEDEPGPGAARWPGHPVADDEVLHRLRDGLDEL